MRPRSQCSFSSLPSIEDAVRELAPRVRAMAASRVTCPGLRDDAYQEGLIAVARAATRFDAATGTPFRNYAVAAARNEISKCAQRNRLKESTGHTLDSRLGSYRDADSLREIVEEWLTTLPQRLQQIFEGLYVNGFTQRELAMLLGVSQPRIAKLNSELIECGRRAFAPLAA